MGLQFFGLPTANYDLQSTGGILGLALAMVLVGLCVHFAERLVQKKSDLHRAIVAGFLSFLAAHAVYNLLDPAYWIVGLLLGLLAFCLVTAGILRVKLGQGIAIGAVSWVMWIVANLVVGYLQAHWVA